MSDIAARLRDLFPGTAAPVPAAGSLPSRGVVVGAQDVGPVLPAYPGGLPAVPVSDAPSSVFAPPPRSGRDYWFSEEQGGGMLVGPGHPMFHVSPSHEDIRAPGFEYLPRNDRGPRYDPLTPPTAEEVSGVSFHGTGEPTDPRRRRPTKQLPGEPNPDHLKPPSF